MSEDEGSSELLPPFRERILINVCQFDYLLYMTLVFQMVLGILSVVVFVFGDLNPASHSIMIINFVLLGVLLALTVTLIYICGRYRGGSSNVG